MSDKTCLPNDLMVKTMERTIDCLVPKYAGKDKLIFYTTQMAMELLRISSPTTMQKLRDEGKIPFYQVTSKLILYKKEDLLDYLEAKKQEKF